MRLETVYVMADGSEATAREVAEARNSNWRTARSLLEHACVRSYERPLCHGGFIVIAEGQEFTSLIEAEKALGISDSTIRRRIKENQPGYGKRKAYD